MDDTRSKLVATVNSVIVESGSNLWDAVKTSSLSTRSSVARSLGALSPPVEKGIQEARTKGYLAGYPMVDFEVALYDGQYHAVDSNEMSFKMAGRLAFRDAMSRARPTILEPVMDVEVRAPSDFAGDLMGDLNGRRGRIGGMENSWRHDRHQGAGADGRDADIRAAADILDQRSRVVSHGVSHTTRRCRRICRQKSFRKPRRSAERKQADDGPLVVCIG